MPIFILSGDDGRQVETRGGHKERGGRAPLSRQKRGEASPPVNRPSLPRAARASQAIDLKTNQQIFLLKLEKQHGNLKYIIIRQFPFQMKASCDLKNIRQLIDPHISLRRLNMQGC